MHYLMLLTKFSFPLLFSNRILWYLFLEHARAYSMPSPASSQWHFGILSTRTPKSRAMDWSIIFFNEVLAAEPQFFQIRFRTVIAKLVVVAFDRVVLVSRFFSFHCVYKSSLPEDLQHSLCFPLPPLKNFIFFLFYCYQISLIGWLQSRENTLDENSLCLKNPLSSSFVYSAWRSLILTANEKVSWSLALSLLKVSYYVKVFAFDLDELCFLILWAFFGWFSVFCWSFLLLLIVSQVTDDVKVLTRTS